MGVLKKTLYGLLGLIVVLTLVSFLLPSPNRVERSTTIDAPIDKVFEQVNNLENWENWSPWIEQDSTIKTTFGEVTSGKGASNSWTSENSGDGSLEITTSEANQKIKTALDFGFMGRGDGEWTFSREGGSTKVSWAMQPLPAKNPIAKVIGAYFTTFVDIEPDLIKSFDKGLANMKTHCEKMNDGITEIEFMGTQYLAVRNEISWAEMADFYSTNFPKIMQKVMSSGKEMAGKPRSLFYTWDMENQRTDLAAAIPVMAGPDPGDFKMVNIGPGEAKHYSDHMTYDYYGSYDGSQAAHEALGQWLEKAGKTLKMPVVEEYLVDPASEPDTSKWHTRLIYSFEE